MRWTHLLVLPAAVALTSCAARPRAEVASALPAIDGRGLVLVDGRTDERVAWSEAVAGAAAADAVLIGELHNQPAGQAFLAAFFEDVLSAAPGAAAALEFYERDQQAALDDYLDGVVSPHEFRRLTGRESGNDSAGHRAIIGLCKDRRRPVAAANAPRRYVKLARTDGYERLAELGPEQRRLYRLPDAVTEGPYREEFFELMRRPVKEGSPHAAEEAKAAEQERIEAMFRAQTLWDWTMADSVARMLDQSEFHGGRGPARPVVLVVGRFHTDSDGGLVQALRAIRPGTRIFTVSFEPRDGPPVGDDRRGVADLVVFVGEENP